MPEIKISLVHLVRKPLINSPGKPPLLVLLHGVGSNEEDLMGLAPFLDGRFLVVSLRGPQRIAQGGYGWYRIEWTATGIKRDEQEAVAGQASAERAVDELVAAYGADSERVYLMGFSQGAIMSLAIALTHPEQIAGAVIMSGRLLPGVAGNAADPGRLTGLPILVVHGINDNVLTIDSGRQIESYLKHTPVALTYREYSMAHTVSQESLDDVSAWLTAQLDRK